VEGKINYSLPVLISLVKLAFRLGADRKVTKTAAQRALLIFPFDLAFLAFSFGAAIFATAQALRPAGIAVDVVLSFAALGFIITFFVAFLCQRIEEAFAEDNFWKAFSLSLCGYLAALVLLFAAIKCGGLNA
jgi:hypothetical protein